MTANSVHAFQPEYAVPPGETLLEVIESLGLSQSELAERTGRPKKTISEIINGKAAITPETALQLERVLGVPASLWNSLEQHYRAALARVAERERLEQHVSWLKEFPLKAMISAGYLKGATNAVDQLDALLSFFGVASVDAWREIWAELNQTVAFRRAATLESEFGAVTAWLRHGELRARHIQCAPFELASFKSTLEVARGLTREAPDVFQKQLPALCAQAGVAVAFIPELPRLRVCGATRWVSTGKAMVLLTLRYKTDDQLWFTFFHEAAHIILHGKRATFLEQPSRTKIVATAREHVESAHREAEEMQANRFARDFLLPPEAYAAFVRTHHFDAASIKQFATDIGVSSGIVVGRLQHDRILPYPTPLNRLKRRFRWATP